MTGRGEKGHLILTFLFLFYHLFSLVSGCFGHFSPLYICFQLFILLPKLSLASLIEIGVVLAVDRSN